MKRKTFIYTFVLGSGSLLFHGLNLNAAKMSAGNTLIKMIYNNTGECSGLENAWGLSVWIENEKGVTLFDTGGDAKVLAKNIKHLGLNLQKIDRIIISHNHWDHKGGLEYVLTEIGKPVDVYVVIQDKEEFQNDYPSANIIGIDKSQKIFDNIWSTGTLNASGTSKDIDEHSIMILDDDSMMILNGCSHPGIVKIVKRAKEVFPEKKITLVAGGFHLMRKPGGDVREISSALKALGVEKLAPSHCTGDKSIEIFRESWGDRFVDMHIGDEKTIRT